MLHLLIKSEYYESSTLDIQRVADGRPRGTQRGGGYVRCAIEYIDIFLYVSISIYSHISIHSFIYLWWLGGSGEQNESCLRLKSAWVV